MLYYLSLRKKKLSISEELFWCRKQDLNLHECDLTRT